MLAFTQRRAAAVLVAMTAAGFSHSALAISVHFDGVSPFETVSISTNGGDDFHNYRAGLNNFIGGPGNPLFLEGPFTGFCIDFTQSISSGHSYSDYAVVPVEQAGVPEMGPAAASMIAELWARHFEALNTSTEFAAFQGAIWEILYDGGLSLSQGSFRMSTGDVRTLANTWLDELDGSPAFQATHLVAIRSPTTQDMIVPAPGAAALLLGGMGVTMLRRKRR